MRGCIFDSELVGIEIELWYWVALYFVLVNLRNNEAMYAIIVMRMKEAIEDNHTILQLYNLIKTTIPNVPNWEWMLPYFPDCNDIHAGMNYSDLHVLARNVLACRGSEFVLEKAERTQVNSSHNKYLCAVASCLSLVSCCLCTPCICTAVYTTDIEQRKQGRTDNALLQYIVETRSHIQSVLVLWDKEFIKQKDFPRAKKAIEVFLPSTISLLVLEYIQY